MLPREINVQSDIYTPHTHHAVILVAVSWETGYRSAMAEKSQPFRFGSMIRDARKAQGLTLPQLAARASVNPHAVWEIETQGGGRMETVAALMTALDLRLAGLPRGPCIGKRLAACALGVVGRFQMLGVLVFPPMPLGGLKTTGHVWIRWRRC